MKIAILAPIDEPVPPKKYGGTELVVANLTEGLVKRGHQVTLLASGNSATSARLVPIFHTSLREMPLNADRQAFEMCKYIGTARVVTYLADHQFDIIHNHISSWRLLPFTKLIAPPIVTTLHGPLTIPHHQIAYQAFPEAAYVSISKSQRRPKPDLNYIATVYNGIAIEKFPYVKKPSDYFAFLGRMSPEKGPLQAIQIAKEAGAKLVMAAKVDTVDKAYYEEVIAPLIDGKQIQYIGEVDHAGKAELLGHARALLAPIQWDEPFGLFFIEALACGTPVVVIPRGSVPEIIQDGINGIYLKPDLSNAREAIAQVENIDRSECRQTVEDEFTVEHMVRGYEKVYTRLIAHKKATKASALVGDN